MFDWVLLFIVSFLANTLSALAGGGAGLLQLPALLMLGLPFATALATHKIASVALGLGATIRHVKEGRLQGALASTILVAGLPGVWLGAHVIVQISEAYAQLALGLLTLGLGLYSLLNPSLGQLAQTKHFSKKQAFIGVLGLFFIGFLNGSLTSGTGLFVTLWLIRWYGLDYTLAVSYTLVLVGIFWNGLGAITLATLAPVQWSWLPPLLLGSFLGGYVGAHWGLLKGNYYVKRAFEVLAILVATKLLWNGAQFLV